MKNAIGTLAFTAGAYSRLLLGRRYMARYQLERLRSMLRHAEADVPFYRDWFARHGFRPDEVRTIDDLSKLPVMGKQQLKALRESISDEEIDRERLIEHQTSGSTGMPVSFLRAPHEERRLNMLRWRMHFQRGLRPGDRVAKIKCNWEPGTDRFNRPQTLARSVGLLNTRVFDGLSDPERNYRDIVEFQPTLMGGYPGAIARLAEEHLRQGGRLDTLRRVGVGGETLTPYYRRTLEEAFGVPILDAYGTTEFNLGAWTCDSTDHYHVTDDGIVLQVCRDGVPVAEGERGEIVITSLHSRRMPVIRYAMGDLAVAGPSQCPCGSPFSTIRMLEGRVLDYVRTPDGRDIHAFDLLNDIVLADEDSIRQFQFVQKSPDRFRLLVVPRQQMAQAELDRFHEILLGKLGAGCTVEIELTDDIPAGKSGKRHFFRSEIGPGCS